MTNGPDRRRRDHPGQGCIQPCSKLHHPLNRIPAQVRLETREAEGNWRNALPADARHDAKAEGRHFWYFPVPDSGIEALLKRLMDGEAGILSLSIERAGLHDAFVEIAGDAAARALEADNAEGTAR